MKTLKILAVLLGFCASVSLAQQKTRTQNVFLVLVDGLRWQEVFTGADSMLMNKADGGSLIGATHRERGAKHCCLFYGTRSANTASFSVINTKAARSKSPTLFIFPIPGIVK
jgi:hypothetical protein